MIDLLRLAESIAETNALIDELYGDPAVIYA